MKTKAEIPEPDDFEAKEVFAFFGLASYHAQVCEKGLVNMAVILQARGTHLTPEVWDGLFGQFDSRTFGQLLREIGKIFPLTAADEELLSTALKKRNWIAHQFFADYSVDFTFESGRRKMIEELRSATALFMQADICASRLYEAEQHALGLSDTVVLRLIDKQKEEYRKKNGA
jgi:hypothetical protein